MQSSKSVSVRKEYMHVQGWAIDYINKVVSSSEGPAVKLLRWLAYNIMKFF